ncbi:MAG: pepsin-like aspartic protease, partial [Bacteroidota bacterium]
MTYFNLQGTTWVNEFGSIMNIQSVDPSTGIFYGTYKSDTGATGQYRLTGITDNNPDPTVNSQALSFSISWRSYVGSNDDTQYWVSAFSGQLQYINGYPVITTTYLLQKNTNPADNWGSTIVATATFRQQNNIVKQPDIPGLKAAATTGSISFPLYQGKLADNGATPWVAQVGIGTPAQSLKLMIDTGTDNTWITASQCDTSACQAHDSFNPSNSSTYIELVHTPETRDFGPWGTMQVLVGEDIWHFPETTETEALNFEVSIYYSGTQFKELVADGGIAIPGPFWSHTDKLTESLMVQLLKDGKIGYGAASFWTDNSTGEGGCMFGGVDPSKYDSSTLQWIALQDNSGSSLNYLWQIPLNSLTFNEQPTTATITAFVLDTGSSYFKGPAD